MQLAELWPYVLVVVSGVALAVVFVLMFRPTARAGRTPQRRKPSDARARERRRDEAPRAEGAPRRQAERRFSAAPSRPPPAPQPAAPRPAAEADDDFDVPIVASMRRMPAASPARAEAPAAVSFGAAAGASVRTAEPVEGKFEIPAFLRREAPALAPQPAPPPMAGPPKPGMRRPAPAENRELPGFLGGDAETDDEALSTPLTSGLGRLVYNPPETMRALESEVITVRIVRSRDDAPKVAAAFVGLRGSTPPRAQDVPTGASMTVQLFGPHAAFRIEPRSPLLQVLDTRRGFAEWGFLVTPLEAGAHELELVVAACRAVGGQIEAEDQEAVVVKIRVRVNSRSLAKRMLKAAAAAAGIALVTWLVTVNADAIRSAMSATNGAAEPKIVAPAAPSK